MRTNVAILLLAMVWVGCSEPDNARSRWLQNTLVEDNYDLFLRTPELTRGKFVKMASTPYNFFRGTQPQYLRDLSENGLHATRTEYDSAASNILLIGDPHPENIGSYYKDDSELVGDFNDFDASVFGPFHFDVWRLSVGFYVASETLEFSETDRAAIVEASCEGYVEKLNGLKSGDSELVITRNNGFGKIFDNLFRRAARDGNNREALDEYTVIDGRRTMVDTTVEPRIDERIIEDEIVVLTDEQATFAEKLVENYRRNIDRSVGDIKGSGRRFGAGVSSYPIFRYYVLLEGETADEDDDLLLEFKESRPARRVLGNILPEGFRTEAERVVEAQRVFQTSRNNDTFLGYANVGNQAFKIRNRRKYQKGIGVDRIGDELGGEWEMEDVVAFARLAGNLLAQSHIRANEAANALQLDDGFVSECTDFASAYGAVVLDDYELYLELLDKYGDDLGSR